MLKAVIKVRICCAVVVYEDIIAVSNLRNVSNWHPNRQKTQIFQTFKAFMIFL